MKIEVRLQDFDGKTVMSRTVHEVFPETIERLVPLPLDYSLEPFNWDPNVIVDIEAVTIKSRRETYEIERYFDCNDGGPLAVYRRVT